MDPSVALITGGASGIGRELARVLAREGCGVGAIDLHPEPLSQVEKELSGMRFAWAVADVTERDQLGKAVAKLQEQLGPPDLLIASAGVGFETSALNINALDIETIIRVNLIGVSNSIAAVLPGMLERRRGHLAALSSLASYRGLPRMLGYCASKAGVRALMEAIRVEVKPYGIDVTTICPGWIRTPMTAPIAVKESELMAVEEAASKIRGAIRRRLPFFAFPASRARVLGLLRWLPASLSDRLLSVLLGSMPEKKPGVSEK